MIIGFHGCKGVGKDTAGQFLVDELEFTKVAFADPLKEAVANLFGIDREMVDDLKLKDSVGTKGHVILVIDGIVEYDHDWREFLQRFGTEMGRNTFGKNFWVDLWEDHLYRNSIHEDNVVATDVRFQNEAERIQKLNGVVVEIVRQGHEPDGHESETPLPRVLIDAQITNNGTIDDLKVDVYELVKQLDRGDN